MAQLQHVLACLQQTTGPDPQLIRTAEEQLKAFAQQPGYGCVLCQIALALHQEVPAHLRQLAAVLLKQYVRQHWVAGERGFEPPEASRDDKTYIRNALPAGLRDPDSKIRTAIAMAIAAIANWDWPQEWPGLLENVVGSIKKREDPQLVAGCLQCLSIMAVDLDSEQAPQLLQSLSPELAALVSSPQTPPGLAATCFRIMAELTSALASLSGAYQRQVRDILVPLVQPWVPLLCSVLSSDAAARPSWPLKLAALRLAQAVTAYFSKPLATAMPPLLGATWQLLLALQPLHQALLVEGQEDEAGGQAAKVWAAGSEEPVELEGLLAQLFELLTTFAGKSQFKDQVQKALKDMMYVSIAYLQMTQEQAEAWVHSGSQFVADEEGDLSACRACSQMMIGDVADEFESSALPAVLEGVVRRWSEADAAAAAGRACWWHMREAGLMAVRTCSTNLVQAVECEELPAQHVHQLLDQLLQRDLQPLLKQQQQLGDAGQQFVMARALLVGAELQEVATQHHREGLLQASATAVLSQASSAPLRLLGYRALSMLAPEVPAQQLAQLVPQLLPALLQHLAQADEDSLHLVLELLQCVIQAAAAPGGTSLTPEQALAVAQPVLQVWLQHTSDPVIQPDAQEVIDALASHASCFPSLVAAAAPTLAAILQRGAAVRMAKQQGQSGEAAAAAGALAVGSVPVPEESAMLVEASLDLLRALVKPGQDATTLELCRRVLCPVLDLIQASGDTSELSSAVALLLQFLRTCPPQQLLQCAAASSNGSSSSSEAAGLAALLAATRRLVAANQQDGAVRLAGPLMAQLLKVFPTQLCGPVPAASAGGAPGVEAMAAAGGGSGVGVLLHDTLLKMASGSCSPVTVAHLLEFVVRLMQLDAAKVVDMLAAMNVQRPDGSSINGLAVVVPLWLEHATDMPGGLATKQCAAALLQALQHRHHPALAGLLVNGRPLDAGGAAAGGGRVTRAKARQQGGLKFTQVPAPVKMLQVLGALLAADDESAAGALPFGHEGLWGTDDGDSDSSDDQDGGEGAAVEHAENAAVLKAAGLSASTSNEQALEDVMTRSAAATPAPDDPTDAQDPLSALSIRSIVRQGLAALVAADPVFVTTSAEQLGPVRELQALQQLLNA